MFDRILTLTPARRVGTYRGVSKSCTYSIYPGRMEGWVDLSYPAMERLGIKLMTSRSQVRRANHYTTEQVEASEHTGAISNYFRFCFLYHSTDLDELYTKV